MIARLGWKEYREGRAVWISLALIGVGVVMAAPVFLELLGQPDPARQRTGVLIGMVVLAVTYGLVAGSMLLAGEREEHTLAFLEVLAPRRRSLWAGKLLIGVALALTQGVALAVPFVLAAPGTGDRWALWALPAVTLEALAWGLFAAAFSRTVLAGAGLGGMLYVTTWVVSFVFVSGHTRRLAPHLTARLLIDGLALFGSYRVFCRVDYSRRGAWSAERRAQSATSDFTPHSVLHAPRSTAGLLWLVWRQGRGEWVVLAVAGLVLGAGAPPFFVALWPFVTLVLGVVCGSGVWAREQADASYRLLVHQRFPPGRVWLVKTACGAAAALVPVGLGLLGALLSAGLNHLRKPDAVPGPGRALGLEALVLYDNPPAAALLWVAHGFAVGQLLGIVCRKNLVAVMLALPLAAGLAGAWLPSLVCGGLPAWEPFVVPALLLLAGRRVWWDWGSDNLASRRTARALVACGGLAAAWIVTGLSLRVLEVPDAGEPFDVAEFRASIPRTEDNLAGTLIRTAMDEYRGRERSHGTPPGADAVSAVLREGWPARRPGMGEWLAEEFEEP